MKCCFWISQTKKKWFGCFFFVCAVTHLRPFTLPSIRNLVIDLISLRYHYNFDDISLDEAWGLFTLQFFIVLFPSFSFRLLLTLSRSLSLSIVRHSSNEKLITFINVSTSIFHKWNMEKWRLLLMVLLDYSRCYCDFVILLFVCVILFHSSNAQSMKSNFCLANPLNVIHFVYRSNHNTVCEQAANTEATQIKRQSERKRNDIDQQSIVCVSVCVRLCICVCT